MSRIRSPEAKRANADRTLAYYYEHREEIRAKQNRRYAEDAEFRERMKERNRKNKSKYDRANYRRQEKSYELQQKYGITLDDYEQRLLEQEGRCAACGTAAKSIWALHVDHCHDSGLVRGLLCFQCNASLGQAGDSVDRLMALVAYLFQTQEGTK